MADVLTQLQDCVDDVCLSVLKQDELNQHVIQFINQFFGAQYYLNTRHPFGQIEGQPDMNPHSANSVNPAANGTTNGDGQNGNNGDAAASHTDEHVPDSPEVFKEALHELARDFIIKEHQIEYLISRLPGLGNSEADQDARIKALAEELRQAEKERTEAMQDREQMLNLLGSLAGKCKRVY